MRDSMVQYNDGHGACQAKHGVAGASMSSRVDRLAAQPLPGRPCCGCGAKSSDPEPMLRGQKDSLGAFASATSTMPSCAAAMDMP